MVDILILGLWWKIALNRQEDSRRFSWIRTMNGFTICNSNSLSFVSNKDCNSLFKSVGHHCQWCRTSTTMYFELDFILCLLVKYYLQLLGNTESVPFRILALKEEKIVNVLTVKRQMTKWYILNWPFHSSFLMVNNFTDESCRLSSGMMFSCPCLLEWNYFAKTFTFLTRWMDILW